MPLDTISVTTENTLSDLPSIPVSPISSEYNNIFTRGEYYFRTKKSNILNFEGDPNTAWKRTICGSEVLSWINEKESRGAVNLFVIGYVYRAHLQISRTEYEPAYRLELILEPDTKTALQNILDNGPSENTDYFCSPLRGYLAAFSVGLKDLQSSDGPNANIDDPFPFLWDGRDMAKGRNTLLKNYPTHKLSFEDMVAVEMNIFSQYTGYSLSLRTVYFLAKAISNYSIKS